MTQRIRSALTTQRYLVSWQKQIAFIGLLLFSFVSIESACSQNFGISSDGEFGDSATPALEEADSETFDDDKGSVETKPEDTGETTNLSNPLTELPTLDANEEKSDSPLPQYVERPEIEADELLDIIKGDVSQFLADDAPDVLTRMVPFTVTRPDGSTETSYRTEHFNTKGKNKTPEQCLAIASVDIERRIQEAKQALMKAESDDIRESQLKEVRYWYEVRFRLDTAYQDHKVTEIEKRATKLRAEVEKREKATKEWVDAMVTLDRMRADGIKTGTVPAATAQGFQSSGLGSPPSPIGVDGFQRNAAQNFRSQAAPSTGGFSIPSSLSNASATNSRSSSGMSRDARFAEPTTNPNKAGFNFPVQPAPGYSNRDQVVR